VICTLTGISILCVSGDVWTQTGADGEQLTGIYLTFAAFRDALGPVGVGILGIAVFLFAYSSYLGFFVEFRTSLEYVFGEKAVKYLKWLFFIPPVISCTLPVSQIWDLADMVVGFIFIPNMIAILLLSPQVLEMLKEYTAKCRAEEAEKKKAA
jgi:AGCS family alanine or glycine:cation symporter